MPKALNAETVSVNLQFTADTAQAKRELQQLQNTLKSIVKDPTEGFSLDKKMAEASRYAAELSVHLKKATTQNGTLDFSRLNESIKKSGMSLSQYGDKLLSLGPQGRQAFSQLATAVSQSEIPIRRVNGALAQMGTVLKNTIRWQLSSTAIHAFSGAIQTAYNYAKDLNESLNNIRIVTGYNIDQMDKFAVTANKAAKALSTSTLDYTNAALIYYQQGLSDKEVEARTNVTAKMANVTRQSAEEVSNQLTAIWNNYAKGSENLEYYADVITALGAATASSSAEIATGLEKFAAVGETVGLSYEYATAALATVTATTRQSAEVVGNAFKTLFSRLQGLKLGDTLEDGTDLNKYSSALMAVGVNIKDASGNLKDMDVILDETALKWRTLGKEQQTALAQTVGGARQYTQFMALMNNWDFMEKNLQTARGSSGSLQKQQDIYAESWEAAAKRVKAAWEDVYSSLINDDFFIDLLGFIEKAVKGFKNLIGAMGGIPGILTTIGSLVMTVFGKQMADGITNMTYSIRSLTAHGRQSMINERQQQLNAMSAAAASAPGLRGTQSGETWAENLRLQVQLQDKLAQNGEKIGETERFIFASLMDQVKARQEIATEAAHAVDQARNTLELERDRQRVAAGQDQEKFNRAYNNWYDNRNNTTTALMTWSGNENLKALQNFSLDIQQINQQNVKAAQTAAVEILQAFSRELETSPEGRALQQKLQKITEIDLRSVNFPQIKSQIQHLMSEIQQGLNSVKTTEGGVYAQEFENLGGTISRLLPLVDALTAEEDQLASANKNVGIAAEGASGLLDNAIVKTMTWQEQLVGFGQVAMSAGMIFNQLNGLIDTWSNKDLSVGEQLFSSLASLGMMLPMILNSYKSLSRIIESTVAKEAIYNGLLKIRSGEQSKIIAKQVAGLKYKGAELTADQQQFTIETLRRVLNGEELNIVRKKWLVKIGILTTEQAETGQITAQMVLEGLINKILTKRKLIIAGILVAVLAIGIAWKKVAEHQKEIAEKQAEADKETLSKIKERVSEIHEEEEALNNLVTELDKTVIAYNNLEASKDDVINATNTLLEAYDIEGAALLLLQGNYDGLIARVKEYQEEQRKVHIEELQKQYSGDYKSYDNAQIATTYKNSEQFLSAFNKLTPEQKNAFTLSGIDNYGYLIRQNDTSSLGTVNAYEGLQSLKQNLLDSGMKDTDKIIQGINSQLKQLSEFYDAAKAVTTELTQELDTQTGYEILKDINKKASVNNVDDVLGALTSAYGGDENKARSYLKSQAGWDTALQERDAIREKAKTSTLVNDKELLDLYNNLSDGQKRIFFKIEIAGKNISEIENELLKTGEAEVDMLINASYNQTLGEAKDHFKSSMSSAEIDAWAKKYGITWGEDSAIGISRDEFLAKSGRERANWISSRYRETRDAEYNNALEYKKLYEDQIKNQPSREELGVKRQELVEARKFADSEGEEWYDQKIAEIDIQLNAINRLQEAEDSISRIESERIGEMADAIDKIQSLKIGDKISDEDLDNFKATFGDAIGDLFSYEGNGKWALVVDAIDFQDSAIEGFNTLREQQGGVLTEEQQRQVANYANSLAHLDKYTKELGLDDKVYSDRLKQLASQYPSVTKAVKEYDKVLKETPKDIKAVAAAEDKVRRELKKAEWDTVLQNIEKYVKVLNDSKSTINEITNANQEITKSFKQMFNIDIPDEWLNSDDGKSWIKKLFEAEPDEINDILAQIAAIVGLIDAQADGTFTTIKDKALTATQEGFEKIKSIIESNPIEVDAYGNADLSPLITKLLDAGATAEEVAAVLKAIGQTDVTIAGAGTGIDGTFDAKDPESWSKFIEQLSTFKETIKAGGTIPDIKGTGAKDYTTKIGGGSSGGGSKKQQTHVHEEKRYEYEEEVLDDLAKAYDRVSKAKDRTFGQKRIKLIEDEIKVTQRQIEAEKKLLAEVERYAAIDYDQLMNGKAGAIEVASKNGGIITGDAIGLAALGVTPIFIDGNIENIAELRQAIEDFENAAIDAFNSDANEDALNLAKEQVKWLKQFLEQYIETNDKLLETTDALQQKLYDLQDEYEEKIRTAIEERIQLEKNELKMIETGLRVIQNNMYKSVEAASLLDDKLGNLLGNSSELLGDYQTWTEAFNRGEISDEQFKEHMQEIFDNAAQSIEDILSQWEQMQQYYSDVLDKFDTRLKFETRIFGNLIDELEYYSELMDLSGKEQDYDKKLEILQAEQQVVRDRLAVDKQTQSIYQDEYDKLKAAYDAAAAAGDTDKAEFLFTSLQAAGEKLDEINSQVRDDVKQIAELAQKEFTTTLDKVYAQAEKKLTKGLGFDYLAQTMDLASKRADEYLTKTNQIYETSVLLRKVNQDIDKTDNTSAKARLGNFSKEIQALQEKGELSHYELEDAKARYEILKAQIALEEAQNAKSTVRLQRDNEGNYGYVYTADRDKIDQAEENLAKAQNDRYNLALETQQEYLRKFYDTEREANEALRQLDEDFAAGRIESEEEYRRRRQEIIEYYSGILETYEDIHTQAIGVMHETAAENINDSWTATFGDESGNGLIGKAEEWRDVTVADTTEVDDALKNLKDTLAEVVEPEYENLTQKIDDVTDASDKLRDQLQNDFLPTMDQVLDKISDMTIEWSTYTDQVYAAIAALQQLMAAAQAAMAAAAAADAFDYDKDYSLEAAQAYMEGGDTSGSFENRDKKINDKGLTGAVSTDRLRRLFDAADGGDAGAAALIAQVAGGGAFFTDETLRALGFRSGGYTGNWVGGSDLYGGKLAMLHEKELVLNQEDTKNILDTVHLVRRISQDIDLSAKNAGGSSDWDTLGINSTGSVIEQEVTIHAEFPNVREHNEIEEAFNNLINKASQYAHRSY